MTYTDLFIVDYICLEQSVRKYLDNCCGTAPKDLVEKNTIRIEGRQLPTPEGDYYSLLEFKADYEGTESKDEDMTLEYKIIILKNPGYENLIRRTPEKIIDAHINKSYIKIIKAPIGIKSRLVIWMQLV